MGTKGSWMGVEKDSDKITWSTNMEEEYPHLQTHYKSEVHNFGRIEQVVLGNNMQYFIGGSLYNIYSLLIGVRDTIDMIPNPFVEICALGKSGAYVIQLSNSTIFWDLKGHYEGLRTVFEEYMKVGFKRIKVNNCHSTLCVSLELTIWMTQFAALNVTQEDTYIIAWHDGTVNFCSPEDHYWRWTAWIDKHPLLRRQRPFIWI
jgi:hypothetical protein